MSTIAPISAPPMLRIPLMIPCMMFIPTLIQLTCKKAWNIAVVKLATADSIAGRLLIIPDARLVTISNPD